MYEIVKNIKFRKVNDEFEAQLKRDIKKINCSNNMIVESDNTSSFYKIPKQNYIKLLLSSIRDKYKKVTLA